MIDKKGLVCFFMLLSAICAAQGQYMELRQIVTDSANIFTPQELQGLTTKLTDLEANTTNQLVLLTINDLGDETIEQYAYGVFNQNKLGQKDKDNGILILFAKNARQVRIEVGYGLEPYITDVVASRIIRNTMIPKFKEERYFEGLDLAVDQLIEFLNNPEALEEFKNESDQKEEMSLGIKIFIILFLSMFICAGGFVFYKAYSGLIETFRGMLIGKLGLLPGIIMAAFALIPTLFSLVFIVMPLFFASMVFDLGLDAKNYEYLLEDNLWIYIVFVTFFGISIVIAALKILIKGKEDFKLSLYKNDKSYVRKTFSSTGSHSFGSSSGSSFGSSSSSFSGGGGSSGGGGASGSW